VAVELFNKLYQKEILDNGAKLNEVIAINLDQKTFNSFKSLITNFFPFAHQHVVCTQVISFHHLKGEWVLDENSLRLN
jgi:hypothetical protein